MIPPPASSGEELFSGACCYKYLPVGFPFMHVVIEKQANYLKVDMLRTQASQNNCLV